MTGTIMIVDPLATNRIVLKVKLSAAFYSVTQAACGAEAVAIARRARPDLMLVSGAVQDMTTAALLQALRDACDTPPPVIVLLPTPDPERRIAALRDGAADVLHKPFAESALLARVRKILRQRHMEADLEMQADTAAALGFAEERGPFQGTQRVALLADRPSRAAEILKRLEPLCPHHLMALDHDLPGAMDRLRKRPDLFVIRLDADAPDTGLSMIADLQASRRTRHARLLVLLGPEADHLLAPVLDMGAHDAIASDVSDRELALRIGLLLDHKQRGDAMRDNLETGLQAALRDPLTGLYNRRYALSFLRRMADRAAHGQSSFAVMLADLDHFKAVNDRHGHCAGDTVLAHVARRMQAALRAEDMIARIGGEEFLIVLPDISATGARHLARQLCAMVRETPVPLPDDTGPVTVTVSIGVTLVTPGMDPAPEEPQALIARADRALYEAKSGGRDTVTFRRCPAA
mgnify:CR=1 FL=1